MTRELSREIMIRSELRNQFNQNKRKINWKLYTVQRNKCTSLRRKTMKDYFSNLCKNGTISDRKFWTTIKPFMSDKGCHENSNLYLLDNGTQ